MACVIANVGLTYVSIGPARAMLTECLVSFTVLFGMTSVEKHWFDCMTQVGHVGPTLVTLYIVTWDDMK